MHIVWEFQSQNALSIYSFEASFLMWNAKLSLLCKLMCYIQVSQALLQLKSLIADYT